MKEISDKSFLGISDYKYTLLINQKVYILEK